MRYIATKTNASIRIVGLSTAMANAHDLADWLGIPPDGLFNFKPSVTNRSSLIKGARRLPILVRACSLPH